VFESRRDSRARHRRKLSRSVVERAVQANRLALIRAFCVSTGHSTRHFGRPVQIFFRRMRGRHSHIVKHCPTRAKNARGAQRRRKFAMAEIAESHILSAFSLDAKNHARACIGEKTFRAALRWRMFCAPSAAA